MTATTVPPVVSAADLDAWRAAGREVVLADVRWYLDGRDGRAAYEAGHLPGAVFVDLEAHLTRHDLPGTEGRHPLPTPEAFAASMAVLGIGEATVVVGYDDGGGMTAGRLVVMLRMLGHDAAVLDGGLAAWEGALETGPGGPPPTPASPFVATPWPADRLAGVDDVAQVSDGHRPGVLLDARSYERFTGAVTQIDPRPGHVPGARSAAWESVLDPDTRRFRAPEDLRAHFASRGAAPDSGPDSGPDVIAYCGSGVSACMNVLAMERAGLRPPRLYVGSFSGWSADPDRDVESGDPGQ